jgi:hypothetical protein
MTGREHPFGLEDLVDSHIGELPVDDSDALEEHVFECPLCAARLDDIERIAVAVRAAVLDGAIGANVTAAFLRRAVDDGLTLREYRIEPGQTVACSSGPEDLFVVRLAGGSGEAEQLTARFVFHDLTTEDARTLPPREVLLDADRNEVVLIFPGAEVRSFPRSMWTITLDARVGDRPATFGPYVMDHTP